MVPSINNDCNIFNLLTSLCDFFDFMCLKNDHLMINMRKYLSDMNKGNNKITELRTILQRESQNS